MRPESSAPADAAQLDLSDEFYEAACSAGVHIDRTGGHPIADGKLHRCDALNKRAKRNKHAWYVLYPDDPASGAFGDHQLGIEDTWTVKKPSTMTVEERSALKKRMKEAAEQREAEKKALNAAAAAAAKEIMTATAKADPGHPYLAKKGLPVFPGLRQLTKDVRYIIEEGEDPRRAPKGALVVPIFNPAGELVSVQLIADNGTKRFLKGTAKEGNYHSIGKPGDLIILAEGYATGARLHEATGALVIVAFDSGNLVSVGKAIRKKYPDARILFAADNDRFTTQPVNNPGVTKAREAAEAANGLVAVPEFDDDNLEATDFDDMARLSGLDAVKATLRAALAPPAPIDEAASKRDRRQEREDIGSFSFGGPRPAKPTIRVVRGAVQNAVDESIDVLSDPAVGIYSRGAVLVRPVEYELPDVTLAVARTGEGNVSRAAGAIIISRVEADALCEALTRHADFVKYDRRAEDWLPADCPPEVSRMVLARRGHKWTMPRLRTIIQAPCLRHDGTVIAEPGYDADTGLLFVSNRIWPKVPETPSQRDALDALDVLVEPLAELPFVDNSDRAAAVALLITAVVRPILATAPLFAVTAPAAGTGKSLTVDIASIMATGKPAAVITPSPDEAELEKRIGAAAIAGDSVINIDNVSHTLRSDLLCQLLTQPEIQVRILGKSENQKIPSTALICATGNNLSIFGDLNRRTIRIRLDAGCERPDERAFSFNALDLARRKRAELVTAALTIVRAYLIAGAPGRASPMGSFEGWSDTIRSALIWLNMGDCRGDVEELRGEDPEKVELEEILEALPASPFTAKEIKRRIAESDDLRSALSRFLDKSGLFNTVKFAAYLRRHKNLLVNGRAVQLLKSSEQHGSVWFVGPLDIE